MQQEVIDLNKALRNLNYKCQKQEEELNVERAENAKFSKQLKNAKKKVTTDSIACYEERITYFKEEAERRIKRAEENHQNEIKNLKDSYENALAEKLIVDNLERESNVCGNYFTISQL